MKLLRLFSILVIFIIVTGCGRLDYEERKPDLDEIISSYEITEVLYIDNQSSYLLSQYHLFNTDTDVVSSRMDVIYGVKEEGLLLLFIPDAIDDEIIEIVNPLVTYSSLLNIVEDFNENSESEEFIITNSTIILTNHIYLSNEYDYDLLKIVDYSIFGTKDDFEGVWTDEINNHLEILQNSLDTGIILLVGNYYDSNGIEYDMYLSKTHDGNYIFFGVNVLYHTYLEITVFSN